MASGLVFSLLCGVVLLGLGRLVSYYVKSRRYPPGPAQTWIAGNMHNLPREQSWRTYEAWSKVFGPVLHLRLFDKHIIVLNTMKSATDLLDKRATIYSHRPFTTMNGELVGRQRTPLYASPTEPRFLVYRRMMNHTLGPKSLKDYAGAQERVVHALLRNLHVSPQNLESHLRRSTASIVMRIAYGYEVAPSTESDPFVEAAERSMQLGIILAKPGYWLVDLIPMLKYLPQGFPGAGFKQLAKEYAQQLDDIFRGPVEWTKREMQAGRALPSMTAHELAFPHVDVSPEEWEDIVMNVAGVLYVAGTDTTLSALLSFFYNMMVHPSIQQRAQDEIDSVVGHDRLPTLADREHLPFLDQVIAEVLGWCPPGPLAVPHRLIQDDEYDGYILPAGATVIPNLWAITHDEHRYPNAGLFDPDRFSPREGQPQDDPRRWIWGFGRRTCPGQHLAESTLFINLASVLAVFDISRPLDDNGHEIDTPAPDFTSGMTTRLKPFKCRITRRPQAAAFDALGLA